MAAALALACVAAPGQTRQDAGAAGLRRIERQLTERLRWEALWDESTVPIHPRPSATLAVYLSPRFLFYCSHDLGKCAQYAIEENQLGQRLKSIGCGGSGTACEQGRTDAESLNSFIRQVDTTLPIPAVPTQAYTLGGTVAGTPMKPSTAVTWNMTVSLGTRQQIIDEYRQARPAQIKSLEAWFRYRLQNSGYRSVTIPCFTPSDPEIYVYGDRVSGRPIIISVRWDQEGEQWLEAGLLQGPQSARKIEELKATIESVACAGVKFN